MASVAMTAYDGVRAMQSHNTVAPDSDTDASPTIAELEEQEANLCELEDSYDQDLRELAEREDIDSIDAPAGTQMTTVTQEELSNVGMLHEIGPSFAPGMEPLQATDTLLANSRIYGDDSSDSGTDKADSTFDPTQHQQYQLTGGPDVMSPVV
jgi:hypothetical protein